MTRSTSLTALGFLLSACVPATPPAYLVAPASPSVGLRSPVYAPVMAGVKTYDVVEPKDWRELNRSVGPRATPERSDSDDAARRGR